MTTEPVLDYEQPQISDYGDLLELTESTWGCGHDDASSKSSIIDFFKGSIPFGQPGCRL